MIQLDKNKTYFNNKIFNFVQFKYLITADPFSEGRKFNETLKFNTYS